MRFQSIEEKVIYEKLIAVRLSKPVESRQDTTPYSYLSNQIGVPNSGRIHDLMDKVSIYVGTLEQTRENNTNRVILSHRRVIGRLVVFAKRVIRKLSRWYIDPPWQQQTTFNNAVAPSIGCMTEINYEIIQNMLTLYQEHGQFKGFQQAMLERQSEFEATLREQHVQTENTLQVLGERHTQTENALRALNEQRIQTENLLRQKQKELEDLQVVSNKRVVDLESRMDKLSKLDLEIFSENYNDPWERDAWHIGTFSQSGEDMVIAFLLRAIGLPLNEVSYIDLGANHAKKLSNTYHFYRHGARGVLVEANPALIQELKFYRSEDTVLNRCVSEKSGEIIDFYIMGDSYESGDGLSTPDKRIAQEFITINPMLKIHSVVSVETISFNDIVEHHMGKTPTILNIDIEGNGEVVLRSIDFSKIRPFVIVIEMIPYTVPYTIMERDSNILQFLTEMGYLEYAFTGINSIFLDEKQLTERGKLR